MKLENLNESTSNRLVNLLNRNGIEAGIVGDVDDEDGHGVPYVQDKNGDNIESIGDYSVLQSKSGPIVYPNDDGTVGVRFTETRGDRQPIDVSYNSLILRWQLY